MLAMCSATGSGRALAAKLSGQGLSVRVVSRHPEYALTSSAIRTCLTPIATFQTSLPVWRHWAPRSRLQLGASVWHFRRESRAASPPIWLQNVILLPPWRLSKLFGVRPYYDRWDSRN